MTTTQDAAPVQQPPAEEHADLADIAATLERTAVGMAGYIETRAAQIAQLAIDEHKATADQTIDDLEAALTHTNQRADDLVAELRRQIRVLERQRLQAGYAARHLPDHIKTAAGLQWVDRISGSDLEHLGPGGRTASTTSPSPSSAPTPATPSRN